MMSDWIKELKQTLDKEVMIEQDKMKKLDYLKSQYPMWSNEVFKYFENIFEKMRSELGDYVTEVKTDNSYSIKFKELSISVIVFNGGSDNNYSPKVDIISETLPHSNKQIARVIPSVDEQFDIKFTVSSGLLSKFNVPLTIEIAEDMVKAVFANK